MAENDKQIRLSKAAKELSVATSTIVDFLNSKGIKVEANNPNAKLSEEAHALLLKEYQSDKTTKEAAIKVTQNKISKETSVIVKAEEIHKTHVREESDSEVLIKNTGTGGKVIQKKSTVNTPQTPPPVIETPTPVAVIPESVPEPPPIPEIIAKEEVEKPKSEQHLQGPAILGRIDLDSIKEPNKKGTGNFEKDRKEKEKKEKERKEQQDKEEKQGKEKIRKEKEKKTATETQKAEEQKGEPKKAKTDEKDIPKVEPIIPPPSAEQPEEQTELYRRIEKIAGPNIIGKIDLPVEPKRTKYVSPITPGSAANANQRNKKKRKRTDKKVNVASSSSPNVGERGNKFPRPAGGSGQGQGRGPGQGQGRGPGTGRGQGTGQGHGVGQGQSRPIEKAKKFGHRPPVAKPEVTEKDISDQIKATLAKLSGAGKSKGVKHRKLKRESASEVSQEKVQEQELQKKTIKVTEFVSANELAKLMNIPVTNVISTCFSLGISVSINQRLDAETLSIVAEEFGFKVEFVTIDAQETIEEQIDSSEDLIPRPPIVTVMGHVDHGKTSLLDYIRKANVIAGEAGGITQHIGAYEVTLENGKQITFLDTPGHEAFTAMRARGAKVTDIAIIVISAEDSVMPQTIEAINHALAANVKIVFAINKIDRPGSNPTRIKEQLAKMNLMTTDWGGKYEFEEISAKLGTNVDSLLEKVLLESDILDLKANPDKRAIGTVIESSLDKGRGYITTVLVQTGTLNVGDIVLAGCFSGKVKALFNERGAKIKKAGPSQPALLLGMSGAPQAGDKFNVMEDERQSREIAAKRMQLQREQGIRTHKHITLDEIGRRLAIGNFKELNVIVKGDVDGSIEALADALLKLSNQEIQVNVIHKSVGQISESDVLLASASEAIIIGFQVRPSISARKLAESEQIDIRLYSIIYDAINEIKAAMEGMLAPEFEEKIICNIEIREIFKIPKVGTIAGCMVLDGKITRNTKIRIVRDGIVVFSGELASLKRFKDDVKEVSAGYECGLNIHNFNDIKVGDIVEGYEQVAVKRTLA